MQALLDLWAKSPARLVGAVQAVLLLAIAFGVPITEDQSAKIVAAVLALIVMLGGAEITRSQVYSPSTVAEIAAKVATAPPTAAGPIAAANEVAAKVEAGESLKP